MRPELYYAIINIVDFLALAEIDKDDASELYRILDKLLNAIEEKSENIDMFTNIKDLATAYGILLDKELKVAEINLKRNTGNNEEINKGLQNIADLINNPKKVRTEEDLKE
jgi:hypothetical protein